MKLKYAAGVVLAGLLSGAVWADPPLMGAPGPGAGAPSEFYVNPGVAITGAGAQNYGDSFSLDVGYLRAIHPVASIGWEAGYLFGSKFEGDNFTSDTSLRVLHVAPEIKVGPTFGLYNYQLSAFVIGGGGLYYSHQAAGTVTLNNGATATSPSFDNYNGGWNLGLGVSVNLPAYCSVGFEIVRHEIVNKSTDDFTWVTPAFRFALLFP